MEITESGWTNKDPIGSSPLAHARYLHGSGKGYVTVAQKTHREPWVQHSHSVEKLYEVLLEYAGLDDVYLSLNRCYGTRKRIAEVSAMYSDLDYYNVPELAHIPPEGVFTLTLEALEQAKIPCPSLAMSTGSGLALVWRHKPVSGNVLSKWNLCQQSICEALKELGPTLRRRMRQGCTGSRYLQLQVRNARPEHLREPRRRLGVRRPRRRDPASHHRAVETA